MIAADRRRPARRPVGANIARVGLVLAIAFGGLAAGAGYWQVARATPLSNAPDNPAVVAAARRAVRGEIVDRDGEWLARSRRDPNGEPYRVYRSPILSPVVGYSSRLFGSAGLERTYDAQLVGLARPDPVSDLLKKFDPDPTDPQRLTLSLSLTLQQAAVRALGKDRGAVVMIQPRTGEVLALASTPIYDASAVANPATSEAAFAEIQADRSQPLLPRATQGRYVPGSVFKIVTAMAALDSGAVTPETTYEQQPAAERDGLLVEGFRIRDGHHLFTGNRALDFVEATEVSCNIWYALAGLDTGPEALARTADRAGFDDTIPFDLPLGPSQVTNGGGDFGAGFKDAVELANAAYGQGETVVTPFQMALVAAAVANDGVIMEPHLVTSMTGERTGTRRIEPQPWRQVVTPQVAREIQAAMQRAVEGELGRQFTPGADVPGVEVAGKSGTAELDGGANPHSWFIGFAPVDNPQVAIAVLVEGGGRGGERAAPLAGAMMKAALDLLGD
ncbi:MAG TPA: penicillin-binding transpeptidase domain-containing protein [Candidatus Limnocylindrales bacterium]|jgi:peptidoglycan glycosyltransferase